jgi:membrane protease YdiL (CAAX protease family)
LFVLAVVSSACAAPRPPRAPRPPAADRFERAASPEPVARRSAAEELGYDPTPEATAMLLVLLQRDRDASVRSHAAGAIAWRRDITLDPALELAATLDPDPQVRLEIGAARATLRPWRKSPGIAAGLSLLCPGCGHFYLGDTTGAVNLGATAALLGTSLTLLRGQPIGLEGPATSVKQPVGLALAVAGQNLWFYSIFDAYRDARVARGDPDISRESLADLARAPFRPRVLASPWVWVGVPLTLAAGIGLSYAAQGLGRGADGMAAPRSIFGVNRVNVLGRDFAPGTGAAAGTAYLAALFAPVGIGEETLFRGVIQTELEDRLGPTGGIIASSAIFGAVHVANFVDDPKSALIAVPVITALGTSLGLAYRSTGRRLSTSVAMHFWYDFLLSSVAFAIDPEHAPFAVRFGAPM